MTPFVNKGSEGGKLSVYASCLFKLAGGVKDANGVMVGIGDNDDDNPVIGWRELGVNHNVPLERLAHHQWRIGRFQANSVW